MRVLLVVIALVLSTSTLVAQTGQNPSPPEVSAAKDRRWSAAQSALWKDRNYVITLVADTRVRLPCKLQSSSDAGVVCKKQHGKPKVSYALGDISSIIEPPNHSDRTAHVVIVTVAASAIAASFFVPFGWAVTLRVIPGFLLWSFAWDNGPFDHNDDRVIYEQLPAGIQ